MHGRLRLRSATQRASVTLPLGITINPRLVLVALVTSGNWTNDLPVAIFNTLAGVDLGILESSGVQGPRKCKSAGIFKPTIPPTPYHQPPLVQIDRQSKTIWGVNPTNPPPLASATAWLAGKGIGNALLGEGDLLKKNSYKRLILKFPPNRWWVGGWAGKAGGRVGGWVDGWVGGWAGGWVGCHLSCEIIVRKVTRQLSRSCREMFYLILH